MTYNVFVYGTLKKRQPNNYFMHTLSLHKYIGEGKTKNPYPLVVGTGHYCLPLLLKEEGRGKQVRGEIYEVDSTSLARLDEFEDHPNMYERFEIPIQQIVDGSETVINCWTYFFKDYNERELELEFLDNYDSKAIKGQEYDIRYFFSR